MADDRLRKVSFTGSTGVGKQLVKQSAENLQRVSMELGGNAPFLVFADADLDAAVDGAMLAKMRNMGEACTAANRFLVHADVAAEFAEKLGKRMGAMKVGRGQDDGVQVGPLIDADAVDSVSQLVTDAIHDGAKVIVGAERPDGAGHFYPPTVLIDVPPEAQINAVEVFGPVAPITTFTTEDEAIAAANNTEYGLASYAYTRDLDRTLRLAERLEFGMLGINTGLVSNPAAPFGGVKASGFGREGGFEGIEEYLDTTYVALPRCAVGTTSGSSTERAAQPLAASGQVVAARARSSARVASGTSSSRSTGTRPTRVRRSSRSSTSTAPSWVTPKISSASVTGTCSEKGSINSASLSPLTARALASTSAASVPKRRTNRAGCSSRASSGRGAAPSNGSWR